MPTNSDSRPTFFISVPYIAVRGYVRTRIPSGTYQSPDAAKTHTRSVYPEYRSCHIEVINLVQLAAIAGSTKPPGRNPDLLGSHGWGLETLAWARFSVREYDMFSVSESSDLVFSFDGRSFPLRCGIPAYRSHLMRVEISIKKKQKVRLKMKNNDY